MTDASSGELKLPGLRAHLGDWIYYITFLRLRDVGERIFLATEIHRGSILRELIQREVEASHSDLIGEYLVRQRERFFNSLVIGVYGGAPRWAELAIKPIGRNGFGSVPDFIRGALGILVLDGSERLFAIDGQHRVAGIKKALEAKPELGDEEISAVFVAHRNDVQGMQRTRRLFTTLNRYAKPVNKMQIIALDEDDAVAIITRQLLDVHRLFIQFTSIKKGKNISVGDRRNFTTIITVYDVLDHYLAGDRKQWRKFKRVRPSEKGIKQLFDEAKELWDGLIDHFPPLREVAESSVADEVASRYRTRDGGHLLFRPVGVSMLIQVIKRFRMRGSSLRSTLRAAVHIPMELNEAPWVGLLWDSRNRRMIVPSENQRVAMRVMFNGLGGNLGELDTNQRELREELAGLLGKGPDEVTLPRWARVH